MLQRLKEVETLPVVSAKRSNEVLISEPVTQPKQESLEDLLHEIKRTNPKSRKRRSEFLLWTSTAIQIIVVNVLYAHGFNLGLSFLFTLIVFLTATVSIELAMTRCGRDGKLAQRLSRYSDKRAVGPLLAAARYEDIGVARAASSALVRLLPKMCASDRQLLNAEQHILLIELLGSSRWRAEPIRSPLVLAALKAIQHVGDARAIPGVTRLANGLGSGKDPEVRNAAVECLPFLEEAERQEQANHTLLRASAPGAALDALLMPAAHPIEHDPDELLRTSDL